MGELAGLDPAAFEAGLKVLSPDPHRESQSGELPVTDHPINGVGVELEVAGSRLCIEPLVFRHGTGAYPESDDEELAAGHNESMISARFPGVRAGDQGYPQGCVAPSCHTRLMADVLINMNNRRMDDEDMKALIAAVGALNYSADVDPSTRIAAGRETAWWELTLRWIGDDGLKTGFGLFLGELARWVKGHFRSRRKPPPNRINIYSSDGSTVLASVEVPAEDEGRDDPASGFPGRSGETI